tara:strand:- start:318 stop:434 length:117 start_codon:yes stop_codon:yes gene_type:complete
MVKILTLFKKARTMSEAKQGIEGQYSNAKTIIFTRVPS